LYKLAIKLHEAKYGSVEKCLQVVKSHNCDEAASIKELTSSPSGEEE